MEEYPCTVISLASRIGSGSYDGRWPFQSCSCEGVYFGVVNHARRYCGVLLLESRAAGVILQLVYRPLVCTLCVRGVLFILSLLEECPREHALE
eukprot:COSAG05_NODE_1594_length_4459_cov_7.821682_5_plen_94_part_00